MVIIHQEGFSIDLDDLNYKNRYVYKRLLRNIHGMRILEIGGGGCKLLRMLPDDNFKVNIEINRDRIVYDKMILNIVGDVQDGIPFPDGFFDICIMVDVLENLPHPERAIKEIARCCKKLVLTTPNNTWLRRVFRRMLGKDPDIISSRYDENPVIGLGHVREYHWREVRNMFERYGMRLVFFSGFGILTTRWFFKHIHFLPWLAGISLMVFEKIQDSDGGYRRLIRLNLGCGRDVRHGWVNVDKVKLDGVDVVHDLDMFPYPFDDNSVDYILMKHTLEHLDDVVRVMEECHRILKPNGRLEIIVPYYKYKSAFTDPTHRHFFTEQSMDYFLVDSDYDNWYTDKKF